MDVRRGRGAADVVKVCELPIDVSGWRDGAELDGDGVAVPCRRTGEVVELLPRAMEVGEVAVDVTARVAAGERGVFWVYGVQRALFHKLQASKSRHFYQYTMETLQAMCGYSTIAMAH